MKNNYENANLEVVKIDGVDVIATSQKPNNNNSDNEVDGGGKW